jgi:type I restriction enzyme, S subunit
LEDVRDALVPLPPLAEQHAILASIDEWMEEDMVLVSNAAHTIRLLSERRSALITAAVTGQIDVRGIVPEGHRQGQAD